LIPARFLRPGKIVECGQEDEMFFLRNDLYSVKPGPGQSGISQAI